MNDELLLTKPLSEHSCTIHSMGERLGTEKCLACAYEKGAEDELTKAKQHYEQKIKELEGKLEREKFHHQFAEDVIEDIKEEK